jgi:hypothetical protein
VETIGEEVMDLVDFVKWGVAVGIHIKGFGGEGVLYGELGGMLREVLLEHRSENATHELHDAVVEIGGVLRHVECVGRSRAS